MITGRHPTAGAQRQRESLMCTPARSFFAVTYTSGTSSSGRSSASGEFYVAKREIQEAVRGREPVVLDALGIDWRAGRPHIDCPYPEHGGKRDWRWDEA